MILLGLVLATRPSAVQVASWELIDLRGYLVLLDNGCALPSMVVHGAGWILFSV
jgi:hypothetical protein